MNDQDEQVAQSLPTLEEDEAAQEELEVLLDGEPVTAATVTEYSTGHEANITPVTPGLHVADAFLEETKDWLIGAEDFLNPEKTNIPDGVLGNPEAEKAWVDACETAPTVPGDLGSIDMTLKCPNCDHSFTETFKF